MNTDAKYINILFALIRTEICGEALDDNIINSIDSKTIASIYSLAKAHDLAHLAASALANHGKLGDDEISNKLQKQLMLAAHRYSRIKYDLQKASEALARAKIPFLPLKGSVIRQYYPEPWMRTSCDIDILIHREDTERAIGALESIGFVKQQDTTKHDHQLISSSGVHLELHYSLRQETSVRQADSILDAVWQECSPNEPESYCYEMSGEMFVFYHVVHMANHFVYGGCGIRPFVDLWLLRNKMPYDSVKLDKMFAETGLTSFYKSVIELCDVWMDGAEHSDTTAAMEEFILTGGVYGTVANSATVKSAKGQSKLRTFLKLAFLPRADLEIAYPKLKKYPILLPFYQVKRWFRIFDPKKRERVSTLTAARNSVSREQSDRVKSLLDDLELL